MVRAFAIASMEDVVPGREKAEPRVRIMLEGVGSDGDNLECSVADRSSKTAAGVVSGR
jgi:hypothetical protein